MNDNKSTTSFKSATDFNNSADFNDKSDIESVHDFNSIAGFDGVLGQSMVKAHMRAALCGHRISHAYVFAGPAGTGKTTLARLTAKAILCESPSCENKPCGVCFPCRLVQSGNHPDIKYIVPDKKKSLSVELIREAVVSDAALMPNQADRKVYIIDKADLMTIAAQNALLKTLEEPPPYGVILLCAESEELLLPTVLSRCVRFRTISLPEKQAASFLMERRPELSQEEVRFYASLAGGSPGKAWELSKPGEKGDKPRALELCEILAAHLTDAAKAGTADLLLKAKDLEQYKDDVELLLDIMAVWYRDLAIQRLSVGEDVDSATNAALMIGHIEDARYKLSCNAGFLLTMEVLFLKLGRKME